MPIFHDIIQGEAEWFQCRVGKVTASEFDALATPEFAPRKGEGVKTYLCAKVAELWRGKPLPQVSGFALEQGQILEDEARAWYALEYTDHKVANTGFVEGDDGRSGCSPDALLDDDGGLEIKCPQAKNHVRYLLDGTLPKDYAAQVHFSLYVTGRAWWRFISYHRGYPPLVLHIERDEEICAKIAAILPPFYEAVDAAIFKMKTK